MKYCFIKLYERSVSFKSDTVLTFSLALRAGSAGENMKAVSLFVEIYSICTQNKQIPDIYLILII